MEYKYVDNSSWEQLYRQVHQEDHLCVDDSFMIRAILKDDTYYINDYDRDALRKGGYNYTEEELKDHIEHKILRV